MPGIEHSPNSRASCQTCRSKIWKGSVRVSTRTREGKNKYHHADCYHRGDKSSFYGFSMLNAEARAAIISGQPTESPPTQSAAALPPPACDDPFCAHGPGCKGRSITGLGAAAAQGTSGSAPPIVLNDAPEQDSMSISSPSSTKAVCFEVMGWSWNRKIARAPEAGESLAVVRQPDNPKDSNALLVRNSVGQKIGFLPAALAAHLSPFVDNGTLELHDCTCHSWSDWGTCMLRATAIGHFPPAALPFVLTAKLPVASTAATQAPPEQLVQKSANRETASEKRTKRQLEEQQEQPAAVGDDASAAFRASKVRRTVNAEETTVAAAARSAAPAQAGASGTYMSIPQAERARLLAKYS